MQLASSFTVVVLLGLLSGAAHAQSPWEISADTLVYTDTDNVLIVSPQAGVRYTLDEDGGEVAARLVIDSISSASVDVLSHATTSFSEVRYEADLSASVAIGEYLPSFGYRGSVEPDYVSHGVRAGLQRELGTPDSVLALGYGFTLDTVGRTGTSFDTFSRSLLNHSADLSFTQILSTHTWVRGVYSLTVQDGYMEKPYRHVALFDSSGLERAVANGETLGLENFGRYALARPPEEVPDLRVRNAVGLRAMQFIDPLNGSLRLDYRFYFDDWGVIAHTVEPALTLGVVDGLMLRTFGRFYVQSAASFWRKAYSVPTTGGVPQYRSADRDLGSYIAITGGVGLEWEIAEPLTVYGDASGTYTSYSDFLFLEDMFALVGQLGVRWSP